MFFGGSDSIIMDREVVKIPLCIPLALFADPSKVESLNAYTAALGLTLLAGLATGIGSVIAFFAKRTNFRFLSVSTGFSAGVMLYVSFVEILSEGGKALSEVYGERLGSWINAGAFFAGIVLIGLIDVLIPNAENPHEVRSEKTMEALHSEKSPEGLMRTGLFTALAIGIHNFPEGLATFLAALGDRGIGLVIALAIALHNIPEGISVSVPIYYATGNRKKAFCYSFLSGLAEPVGALLAYGSIALFTGGSGGPVPKEVMGVLFAGVAGIMVYISLDELIPTSRAYGRGHDSMIGLVGGMAVMALSLLMTA